MLSPSFNHYDEKMAKDLSIPSKAQYLNNYTSVSLNVCNLKTVQSGSKIEPITLWNSHSDVFLT